VRTVHNLQSAADRGTMGSAPSYIGLLRGKRFMSIQSFRDRLQDNLEGWLREASRVRSRIDDARRTAGDNLVEVVLSPRNSAKSVAAAIFEFDYATGRLAEAMALLASVTRDAEALTRSLDAQGAEESIRQAAEIAETVAAAERTLAEAENNLATIVAVARAVA
jgi:hypothetical protein